MPIVISALKPIVRSPPTVCNGNYLVMLAAESVDDEERELGATIFFGGVPVRTSDRPCRVLERLSCAQGERPRDTVKT